MIGTWLLFVLIALASHRVTRLITRDEILSAPRDRVSMWLEHRKEARTGKVTDQWQSRLAYLIGCYWCAGMWVSGAVVALTDLATSVPLPVLTWLAAATIVGLIADREPEN